MIVLTYSQEPNKHQYTINITITTDQTEPWMEAGDGFEIRNEKKNEEANYVLELGSANTWKLTFRNQTSNCNSGHNQIIQVIKEEVKVQLLCSRKKRTPFFICSGVG